MKKMIRCVDHYGNWHELPIERFAFRASVYGVLKDGDKFLLVQERWSKLWEFPGGGVKVWESLEDALKREIEEETRIVVAVNKLITIQEDFFYAEDRDQAWHSIRLIYNVHKIGGTLKSDGNQDDIVASAFIEKRRLNPQNTKLSILRLLKTI